MSVAEQWLKILINEDYEPQEFIDNFNLKNLKRLKEHAVMFRNHIIDGIANDTLPKGIPIEESAARRDRVIGNLRAINKAIESLSLSEDREILDGTITFWNN